MDLPRLSPKHLFFSIVKAFVASVILSISFIHVLPNTTENLTFPCLSENPWDKFLFVGLLFMAAEIGTLMVEEKTGENENHHHHGQAYGSVSMPEHLDSTQYLKDQFCFINHIYYCFMKIYIAILVLELGIMVHSLIIGISLGASEHSKIIKPLVVALTFHKFFEGMGLGGCISPLNSKVAIRVCWEEK
ncbi:hypothetical protein CXB51_019229 [Gossypium anomalum]|uniref:Uncharacterized protein n=1 Tax=Gossypium anomalum TaxID=47600 RepID=A0A8J5ZCX6_9ROSI|nr:hypothetical protein CXB51_019229 [Gossypium anomalum]